MNIISRKKSNFINTKENSHRLLKVYFDTYLNLMKINSCNICNKPFIEKINLGMHPCADTFVKNKSVTKD